VAARYAVDINGMTGAYLTKLDVLDQMPAIQVATAYDVEGEQIDTFQMRSELLPRCRPIYQEFEGWGKPTSDCRQLTDLPATARQYLEFLEEKLGVLIQGVSIGREREQMIWTPTGVTT
jgi:adenylosuccinate synthase